MITVDMYQIGEEVYIKAKVTDVKFENGELKYAITSEHDNNPLSHLYTDHQLISKDRVIFPEKEESEPEEDDRK